MISAVDKNNRPEPTTNPNRSLLFLAQEDLVACGVTDMDLAIQCIEEAFLSFAADKIREVPKLRLDTSTEADGHSGITCSASWTVMDEHSLYGCKVLASKAKHSAMGIPRTQGIVVLFDPRTFTPVCIMEASLLNAIRTGAISAIAARLLCPARPLVVGLIGAGTQMRTQLAGLLKTLSNIKEIKVFSRTDSKYTFSGEMRAETGLAIAPVESLSDALDASVIVVATSDDCCPLIEYELKDKSGVTIISLGHHDIPASLLGKMDRIITDSLEQTKSSASRVIVKALGERVIPESKVEELGNILSGAAPGRTSPDENIFFNPSGMAFADVHFGNRLFQMAIERGLGTSLQL
jgi:N-[(2S)-2-amino-2-carboxyethyl]-L-glutamate dehydrogenase